MFVYQRFELNKKTIDQLKQLEDPFKDNPFGEIVFYRTYSRVKEYDKAGKAKNQETWLDVVIRNINGVMSIRKDWYIKNHIDWNENYWQDYANDMAITMFKMHWLPPGRGLWAMGTDFIYEEGSMALMNCGAVDLTDDLAEDICWLMNALMLGVGVGFEPIRNDDFKVYLPKGNFDYVIPDSREGWVNSVRLLINAFIKPNQKEPRFDDSLIRLANLPIKRFGGISSGPEPLRMLHDQIRYSFIRYYNWCRNKGDYYDIIMLKTDLANCTGCCIVAGNVRRSAELCKGSIRDKTFLNLKDYNNPRFAYRAGWGWMSNNSAGLENDEDFDLLGEIAERVIHNAEPGIENLCNFPFGRIGKRKDKVRKDKARKTNPCITGETKVCVADGRGFVPIEDLVGKDVDVYCVDENDEIVIRRMRNPRITGYKQKILKIIFDTGDFIRVTENHKIMLLDRSFVEAKDLYQGAAVAIFSRYIPEDCKGWSDADRYIGIGYSGSYKAEHRIIANHNFGKFDTAKFHVHHKDGNRLNNHPDNLEIKEAEKHLIEDSRGENNANWSGYNHDFLIEMGVALCRKLNRRFSKNEWQLYGPVQQFSEWRVNNLGTVYEFSIMCAELAGIKEHLDIDPRLVRTYQSMIEQGYEAYINELISEVEVLKTCEVCKNEFWIEHSRREQAVCSHSCNNKLRDYSLNTEGKRKTNAKKCETLKEKQLDVYINLKTKLNKIPSKQEWKDACKEAGISTEMNRPSSPFQTWKQLQAAAMFRNHRVAAIVEDGYEDVYNGTVDDYHNFVIGGWESEKNVFGRRFQKGIFSPQCGEQPLCHKECCDLADTLPTKCNTNDEWLKACEYAAFYAHTVMLLPTSDPETNKIMMKNRRLGIGIMDYIGWKFKKSTHEVTRLMRQGYRLIKKKVKRLAEEAGVAGSIRITTVKPNGTTAKKAGVRSGAGYSNFRYTLRRIRVQQDSPMYYILHKANIPHEPDLVSANTEVFEYPWTLPDLADPKMKTAEDVTLWEQAMNLVLLQREWADNAVSNTLMFKPKWLLRRIVDGKNECQQYIDLLKDIHIELPLDHCPSEIVDQQTKLKLWYNDKNVPIKIEEYNYNPRHEEDDIEPVLSAIVPLIKTCTLSPHTPKGVYKQMPEEGITKEEYERRVAEIKPIDWNNFVNNDVNIETDKYCTGDKCEII